MSQSRKTARQQAMARRQSRKRRRLTLFIALPVGVAAIVAAVALSSQPGYSGLDVIGKRPAIVQVLLPG
jgi:ABC-type Fe3+ transport system permease subunit